MTCRCGYEFYYCCGAEYNYDYGHECRPPQPMDLFQWEDYEPIQEEEEDYGPIQEEEKD